MLKKLKQWFIFKILKIPQDTLEFAQRMQAEREKRKIVVRPNRKNDDFEIIKNNICDLEYHTDTDCCDNYSKSVAAEISIRLMLLTNN